MRIPVSAAPYFISDNDVRAHTGRDWAQWFALLDGMGAQRQSHDVIAALLDYDYEVEGWYVQVIAREYGRARRNGREP
jgi:hypothetical protein